jgi:hypothetical protein
MERRAPAIVIFTRNRPNLLRRQARFHAEYPGQMIVVDASEQPIDDLRLPPGGAYLHRPGMSMYGRIEAGVAAVESLSCLLCADDDYALPDALLRCGEAIAEDPEVAYATGTTVHFHPGDPSPDRAIPGDISEILLELRGSETPLERFRLLLSRGVFHGLFYGCIRTTVARQVGSVVGRVADEDGLVAEQSWPLLPSLFGKMVMVDRLLLCRRIHDRNYAPMDAHMGSFDDIAEWRGFGEMRDRLERLAANAGLDADATAAVIDSWREFGAATGRGRRSERRMRAALPALLRRRVLGVLKDVHVGLSPRAWFDKRERAIVRSAALRATFKCGSYPWSDATAGSQYERLLRFDMRCSEEERIASAPIGP